MGCEVREYKNIRPSDLAEYDMVIYGGWIMANMVFGYDKIKTLGLKNLVVFGVGITVPSEEVAAKIAEQNQIPLEKKEEKTAEDLHMLETFKGADHTDRGAIKELIAYCM